MSDLTRLLLVVVLPSVVAASLIEAAVLAWRAHAGRGERYDVGAMGVSLADLAGRIALQVGHTASGMYAQEPSRSSDTFGTTDGIIQYAEDGSAYFNLWETNRLALERAGVRQVEIAGISTGKPPASQIPRFTSSARWRKCVWQGLMSLQVLMIAMTGFPM